MKELTQKQKDALALVEAMGDIAIEDLDDANVPVNIFLNEDKSEGGWNLTFNIFMPRKLGGAEGGHYKASTPEPLRKLVELFIKPFYAIAMKNIDGIINGTNDSHYYWE